MTRDLPYLFADGDLGAVLRAQEASISATVDGIPQDQFLASTDEHLVEHVVSKLEVEALVLHEDHSQMDQHETQVDVSGDYYRVWSTPDTGPRLIPGTSVTVTIPFTGDNELWKLRPSTFIPTYPHADIHPSRADTPGHVVLTITKPHDTPNDAFKHDLDRLLNDIRFYLEKQQSDVNAFNEALPAKVQAAINARRERIGKHEDLSAILDIPLRPREGAPPIKPIKVEKKLTKPLPPPKPGQKAQPGITEELYEQILSITRHVGKTFETTPKTYGVHGEEELRDIMLANLNGHYQGQATGETFRKKGKTDITIEEKDRAAFINECKVWRGRKELEKAVGQLLSYTTWRDCKTALTIFNKDVAGFTKLLETVPETLSQHPLFVKDHGPQAEGEWRYTFRSAEDENQHITVHVFLFNLFHK